MTIFTEGIVAILNVYVRPLKFKTKHVLARGIECQPELESNAFFSITTKDRRTIYDGRNRGSAR